MTRLKSVSLMRHNILWKDKDALLLHVIDTLFAPYHEEFLSILNSESNPTEKLGAYFRLTCSYLNEQRGVITIIMQAKDLGLKAALDREPGVDRTIIQIIAKIIKEGITQGVFRRCDADEAAVMIYGAMEGFIESKIAGPFSERTLEEDVENCMALLLPGLLPVS